MNVKYPNVFSPIRIGSLSLKNRIAYAPMVSCLSSETGEVTTEYVEFIGQQARTGAALITIGATCVNHDHGIDVPGELSVVRDENLAGLSRLAAEAHRYGAKLSVELCHGGRASYPPLLRVPCALAPSNFPAPLGTPYIKEMDQRDIESVIKDYVDCSLRCKTAGFDMIMIHAAHGNLIAQFLSSYSNHRTDCYGGALENRMRFPLTLIEAVRKAVGPKFGIDMRVSGDEIVPGGQKMDEVLKFLKLAQQYVDTVQISQGLIIDPDYMFHTISPYYYRHCHNVHFSEQAKKVLDIPVSTVGSINTIADAEDIIASGKADFVGMARQLLSDFNTVKNAFLGEDEKTRPCLRCLEGCTKFAGIGWPLRCAINPVTGREARYKEIHPASAKKKAMVVGGGPAGMMAAQTLAKRGHDVVLYEKSDSLGGTLKDIHSLSFKADLRDYLAWDVRETLQCGAKIILNTEATPEIVEEEKPDALFIAVGAAPLIPPIPGIDSDNVKHVLDIDNKRAEAGGEVVVCGGGASGLECALELTLQGKTVTVIDRIPAEDFGRDMSLITRRMLLSLLKEHGVRMLGGLKVLEFKDKNAICINGDWQRVALDADTFVLAFGMEANAGAVADLSLLVPETYVIGDCAGAKNIYNANHMAFDCAVET
jgi:2,4-dienoyl-CoA reductase-like NADH-dependent reductase (Old Yellow Enzyme family)/NADPH-dependent glutamate synthase beta subunit-like oxidoreductase